MSKNYIFSKFMGIIFWELHILKRLFKRYIIISSVACIKLYGGKKTWAMLVVYITLFHMFELLSPPRAKHCKLVLKVYHRKCIDQFLIHQLDSIGCDVVWVLKSK